MDTYGIHGLGKVVGQVNKTWTDVELKEIWECLFDTGLCKRAQYEDKHIQGVIMLLEIISENIKQMGARFASLMVLYKTSVQELEGTKEECKKIKSELRSISLPCDNCNSLQNKLKTAKQRAEDAENRMNSIAKILRIGNAADNNTKDRMAVCGIAENDLTLVSQMLLVNESPKRKHKLFKVSESIEDKYEKGTTKPPGDVKDNELLVPGTLETSMSNIGSPQQFQMKQLAKEVPETIMDPEKALKAGESDENILLRGRTIKKFKKCHMSNSVNMSTHLNKKHEIAGAKKNLTTDFANCQEKNGPFFESRVGYFDFSPQKNEPSLAPKEDNKHECGVTESSFTNLNLKKVNGDDSFNQKICSKDNSELDRIWFSNEENNGNAKEETADDGNKIWKLRQNKCPDKKTADGKKLKQTTLSVATKPTKKQDLSLIKEFNSIPVVGSDLPLYENNLEEDDDIVLPSPKQKKNKKRQQQNTSKEDSSRVASIDFSLFAPAATSTQLPKPMLGNASFDRVPTKSKKSPSPKYNYKRPPVKGKQARAKLQGEECSDCAKYYKAAAGQNLSPSKLKERLNSCSRHRNHNNHQQIQTRPKTPPGFWDIMVPNTEECRDKELYTSVYCFKGSKN